MAFITYTTQPSTDLPSVGGFFWDLRVYLFTCINHSKYVSKEYANAEW